MILNYLVIKIFKIFIQFCKDINLKCKVINAINTGLGSITKQLVIVIQFDI